MRVQTRGHGLALVPKSYLIRRTQKVKRYFLASKLPTPYREIGDRIQDFRREAGRRRRRRFSQKELANLIGVAEGTVTAWETGRQRPQGENLMRLARALEVRPEEIIGDASSRSEPEPLHLAGDPFASGQQWEAYLRRIAPAGEMQSIKIDVLEGLRRVITATARLPQWWFDLYERVKRGEI